jgi:hypothetical protein
VAVIDRDAAVDTVLSRLASGRSAWNAADIRGQAEQLIAAAGIVVDAAVRLELAEDFTARAVGRCVSLLVRDGTAVLEHIRAWTSQPVLDVEADLTDRLAARSGVGGAEEPALPRAMRKSRRAAPERVRGRGPRPTGGLLTRRPHPASPAREGAGRAAVGRAGRGPG